jgi:hypothetical protein
LLASYHLVSPTQAEVEAEKQRCLAELRAAEDANDDDDDDDDDDDSDDEKQSADTANATATEAGDEHSHASAADADEDADDDDSSSHRRPKHGGGGATFNCDVCKKKYKSEGQLESHLASKAHLKAAKDAAGASRKPKAL